MFRTTLDKLMAVRNEKKAEDGGFTLIELLVVVVIIGILIAIAIPLYLNYEKGANDKAAESDLRAAITAVNQCYTSNNNTYPSAGTQNGTGSGANFSFTGCSLTTNTSTGTTLTYTAVGSNGFSMTGTNSSGSGVTYSYNSTSGSGITSSS